MPQAPGFSFVSAGTTASGTGASLGVNVPTGVVDGDLLRLAIAHKSGAFSTPPAGWTLVAQDTTGTVWVELYWRRASSEPASYTINGLATVALASIDAYRGLTPSGSAVDVASTRVVTVSGTTRYRVNAVTSTVADGLILSVVGTDANVGGAGSVTVGTRYDADAPSASAPTIDPALRSLAEKTAQSSASGGGVSLHVHEAMQIVPGPTGQGRVGDLFGGLLPAQSVGIFAVFIPDSTTSTPGTRYYPSHKHPVMDPIGPLGGTWDSSASGPRGYGGGEPLWEFVQQKPRAGDLRHILPTRNAVGVSCLTHRFCTPPLAAGTLGGTLDLCQFVNTTTVGFFESVRRIRYHIVAYVTIGNTTGTRGMLLDYSDTVDFPTGSVEWRRLAAPQALSPVARTAGDRIIVEIGVDLITPAPPTPPTRPPSTWLRWEGSRGACLARSGLGAGVAWPDAVLPNDSQFHAPWVEFSETIPELGVAPPTLAHTTCATAEAITSLPFTTTLDTSAVATPQRAVWYRWTAAVTEQVIFHTFGSSGGVEIVAYDTCGDDTIGATTRGQQSADTLERTEAQIVTACSFVILAAQAGQTYYLRVRSVLDAQNAPASGGRIVVGGVRWQPPAANDVLLVSQQFVARYTTDGVLTNIVEVGGVLSGLAIDYTGRGLVDQNDGVTIHTGHRVLVGVFGGANVQVLDLATFNNGDASTLERIGDVLPSSGVARNVSTLAVDAAGRLWVGYFGNGFTRVADSGASYLDAPATANSAAIIVTDAIHGDDQPGAPFPEGTVLAVPVEAGGTNYLDLTSDGTRLAYTSGGWYVPVGGTTVYEVDPFTGAAIASRPVSGGPGPNPGPKGHQPLSDGSILVCTGGSVQRVRADGTVTQTFTPTPTFLALSLADVEVQEDETTFWVLDEASTTLHKFDLLTGAQLLSVYTRLGYGTSTSLAIYRPNGIIVVPPSTLPPPCPAILDPTPAGGGVCPVAWIP